MAERRNAFLLTVFEVDISCVKKMKVILIHTDGYFIDYNDDYRNIDEARKEMSQQYDEHMPAGGLSPEWEDMSYFTDDDAILYANGENVHVWRIITV